MGPELCKHGQEKMYSCDDCNYEDKIHSLESRAKELEEALKEIEYPIYTYTINGEFFSCFLCGGIANDGGHSLDCKLNKIMGGR